MVSGWQVLLKLCFQVFIILSSADEAGVCRVHEVGGVTAVLMIYRVVFSDQGGYQPTNFNFEALVGWLLSYKRSGWLVVPT